MFDATPASYFDVLIEMRLEDMSAEEQFNQHFDNMFDPDMDVDSQFISGGTSGNGTTLMGATGQGDGASGVTSVINLTQPRGGVIQVTPQSTPTPQPTKSSTNFRVLSSNIEEGGEVFSPLTDPNQREGAEDQVEGAQDQPEGAQAQEEVVILDLDTQNIVSGAGAGVGADQDQGKENALGASGHEMEVVTSTNSGASETRGEPSKNPTQPFQIYLDPCLLYTSPSPRDATLSRMPSSA